MKHRFRRKEEEYILPVKGYSTFSGPIRPGESSKYSEARKRVNVVSLFLTIVKKTHPCELNSEVALSFLAAVIFGIHFRSLGRNVPSILCQMSSREMDEMLIPRSRGQLVMQ